jgi:hypothetical protein
VLDDALDGYRLREVAFLLLWCKKLLVDGPRQRFRRTIIK